MPKCDEMCRKCGTDKGVCVVMKLCEDCDKTDMPKEIWALKSKMDSPYTGTFCDVDDGGVRYIRADTAPQMDVEALKTECANVICPIRPQTENELDKHLLKVGVICCTIDHLHAQGYFRTPPPDNKAAEALDRLLKRKKEFPYFMRDEYAKDIETIRAALEAKREG